MLVLAGEAAQARSQLRDALGERVAAMGLVAKPVEDGVAALLRYPLVTHQGP